MSDLWEIVLPEKLQVGDIIAKHCSEAPQVIVTIEQKVVYGITGSYVVNDNHNRPLLNWMPVYRRAKLNRHRTVATVAKMLVEDKTIPDGERLAGALMQMLKAGGAKPYEVCDE